MNFYTAGARMERRVKELLDRYDRCDIPIDKEDIESMVLEREKNTMKYGCMLALAYKEIASDILLAKSTYFITIRPETKKICFSSFKAIVDEYTKRKMFKHIYCLSYEQKGTSLETLGEGFHVHIIAETNCRSKKEVLRNTISTFKNCTAENCIQVDLCKNPEETSQRYLIDYESKDGHKKLTQEWDEKWRVRVGLACPIKSDEGTQIIMIS